MKFDILTVTILAASLTACSQSDRFAAPSPTTGSGTGRPTTLAEVPDFTPDARYSVDATAPVIKVDDGGTHLDVSWGRNEKSPQVTIHFRRTRGSDSKDWLVYRELTAKGRVELPVAPGIYEVEMAYEYPGGMSSFSPIQTKGVAPALIPSTVKPSNGGAFWWWAGAAAAVTVCPWEG